MGSVFERSHWPHTARQAPKKPLVMGNRRASAGFDEVTALTTCPGSKSWIYLDAEAVPAYLESTSEQNRRLYRRHGYTDMDRRRSALPTIRFSIACDAQREANDALAGAGDAVDVPAPANRSALRGSQHISKTGTLVAARSRPNDRAVSRPSSPASA